jgi:hypothetical protein
MMLAEPMPIHPELGFSQTPNSSSLKYEILLFDPEHRNKCVLFYL